MPRSNNIEIRKATFIKNANLKYDNKFDYSLVNFKTAKIPVDIICPDHGIFTQTPTHHLRYIFGCPKCAIDDKNKKSRIIEKDIFINNANLKHNNKFDYSLVDYQHYKTKVKIICPEHGVFEQSPTNHLNAEYPCPSCYAFSFKEIHKETDHKNETEKQKFIENAVKKHGNKFDYSLVEYISAKIHVDIICPEHGVFSQSPDKHLNSKYGCMECWSENRSSAYKSIKNRKPKPPVSFDDLKKRVFDKHGDRLTLKLIGEWHGLTKTNILAYCPEHGNFETIARNLILLNNTCGCPKCGKESSAKNRTKSYANAIEQIKIVHGDKYTYPIENEKIYKNKKSKIKICCPEHGIFTKSAQKHLSGQGCIECGIEQLIKDNKLVGGYNSTIFIENPKIGEKPAILYYLKINDGKYYKIGITSRKLNIRMGALKSKSNGEINKIEAIWVYNDTLLNCYNKEQFILVENSEYRMGRRWSTELFSKDILPINPYESIIT